MTKKEFCKKHGLTEAQFLGEKRIGGSISLNSLTSIPEGFNPTVGGSLSLNSLTREEKAKVKFRCLPDDFFFTWENGKYILVDGVFSEVVSRKGNVLRVKSIGGKQYTYIVTDGHGRWAHGDTLKGAREDLVYKIGDRDTSEYEGLSLESSLSLEKAIEAYRVITGACSAGTRGFVKNLPRVKRKYKIKEIVELTRGAYGNQAFEEFFVN